MILEIVILAAIAAFLGLRLYSVLGRRAEHEEEHAPQRFERPDAIAPQGDDRARRTQPDVALRQADLPAGTENGVRAIAARVAKLMAPTKIGRPSLPWANVAPVAAS